MGMSAVTRFCKICKRRFPIVSMTKTYVGWTCAEGQGCQRAQCQAKRRSGIPCTSPGIEERNGLDLCRTHAIGFDIDSRDASLAYAMQRVTLGVG